MPQQLLLDIHPPAPPTLDNFVPGINAEALGALDLWARGEEGPLFLWGEAGCGRSHLLRAAVDAARAAGRAARYVDAALDPALAAAEGSEGIQAWAVDNAHRLDEAGQIALFNLYNRLRASGGALLAAADQSPLNLALREDLRTRLGQMLVFRIHPLSDAEKHAALAQWAQARGLTVGDEVLHYLLRHAARDMRSLMALVAALDEWSLALKQAPTLPLLKRVLEAAQEREGPNA